ncbi:MAG: hypothetical protein RLZZ393_1511 [Pseudomonadota bacterium]|jgi:hypothetical protein
MARTCAMILLLCLAALRPAMAWSPQGHQTVGAIADRLLVGTRAGEEVRRILGDESLRTASLWADCLKSVTERLPQHYIANPRYKECHAFESSEGRVAMEDYVRRNLDRCHRGTGQEACHRQYHYADVDVRRQAYSRRHVGASDHDVVAAIEACVAVLQGRPAPLPFDIASRREALRLLAHFVGDIHQPLHVGTVYLDEDGIPLDPDLRGAPHGSDTHGGNALEAGRDRLHGVWDRIPPRLKADRFAGRGASQAAAVARTAGLKEGWAEAWATESLHAAAGTYAGMRFGAKGRDGASRSTWQVRQMPRMGVPRDLQQERQLVKAGARLAQLLEAVWP